MKIRNGYWLLKDGIDLLKTITIRDIQIDEESVSIYSMCKPFTHRGDTLNIPMLTTVLSSPVENIIRVRTYRHKGSIINTSPSFDILKDKSEHLSIEGSQNSCSLKTGSLEAKVSQDDFQSLNFFFNDKSITSRAGDLSGHVTTADRETFMCEYLKLSAGETIYGMGERFTPLVKNGQTVEIWNEDGGTSSEQAYKNIPFYLSSKGYGVFVATPGRVSFETASEVVTAVQFSVQGEMLEYFLIGGNNPKEVLKNYSLLTGRPALPPKWSFGMWLTTSFTTDYNEETVLHFIDGMAERNLPLQVFHFDCFWMKEFQWVDLEWNKEMFPEPEAMLTRLKNRGLKISLWINPYIAQKSKLFDDGLEKGYLVKRSDGSVWQWDLWQAGMALVDFTNPEAKAWFKESLRKLIKMGVDTFKTDFGERIPINVVYHDGSDPKKMHNYYTYIYNKTVFELLEEEYGKNKAVLFARSATAGSQKFPVHWGGDCSATYESMAESLRGGLSLSLSGFGFWSHDISGFEKTATSDLYKRWVAFGLLSTHSRLHGSESYRVPWNFDDESCDVVRFFTNLKCRLMPYIYSQAVLTSRTGIPMMRAMALEFIEDNNCRYLDMQYMFGENLLVAPVFNDSGIAEYYLPEGTWTHFISGETIEGGRWIKESYGYMSLPLFARPNSIITVGNRIDTPEYDYNEKPCFHLFNLENNHSAEGLIFNEDGREICRLKTTRNNDSIKSVMSGDCTEWSMLLRGIFNVSKIEKGSMEKSDLGLILYPDTDSIIVNL